MVTVSFNNCFNMKYVVMTYSGTEYTYTYTTETDKTIAMQNFLLDPSTWTQANIITSQVISETDALINFVESPITLTNDTRTTFVNELFYQNIQSFNSIVNSFVVDNTVLDIPVSIPSVSTVRAFNAISGNGTNDFIVTEITTSSNIGTYVAMDTGSTIKINITDPSDSSSHYINVNKDNSTQVKIYIDGSSSGTTYGIGETVFIFNNSITIGSVSQIQLLPSSINGNFKYAEKGVLDKTHLRFFAKKNIIDLFEMNNYKVEKIKSNLTSVNNKSVFLNKITFGLLEEFLTKQYFVVCYKSNK